MTNFEVVALGVGGAAAGLSLVVHICIRGTTPEQRPAILRALADLLRSAWPPFGVPMGDRTGLDQPVDRQPGRGRGNAARGRISSGR